MTDFLTRLVDRTLSLAPVVGPIIPPMFGPGPNIQNDYPSGSEQDNEAQSDSDKMQTNHLQETLPASHQLDLMHDSIPKTRMNLVDPSPGQQEVPLIKKFKFRPESLYYPDSDSSSQEQVETIFSRPITGKKNQSNLGFVSKHPNPEDLTDSKRLKENILKLNEPVDRSLHKTSNTQPEETSSMKPYPPREIIFPGIKSNTIAAPKSPSTIPTIKVNIGRVEVRAIKPSLTSASQTRQSIPSLSLSEYLKQRNGGHR